MAAVSETLKRPKPETSSKVATKKNKLKKSAVTTEAAEDRKEKDEQADRIFQIGLDGFMRLEVAKERWIKNFIYQQDLDSSAKFQAYIGDKTDKWLCEKVREKNGQAKIEAYWKLNNTVHDIKFNNEDEPTKVRFEFTRINSQHWARLVPESWPLRK
mmetsp:Transcript_65274/g.154150  ORF Transcript_65274/g.154150 Transcript_65274/m.154150 type:complete len:157 (+) Transcript_65274:512-982(+)